MRVQGFFLQRIVEDGKATPARVTRLVLYPARRILRWKDKASERRLKVVGVIGDTMKDGMIE